MKNILWLWLLFFAAIFLYTFNLGKFPLRDWDEGIVASVAREIYRANVGDYTWLYPQNIDGSPYWNKPPLIHNLIALNYHAFGVSEWSTRLIPSLISALCVPVLYLIGKKVFTSQKAALFSAIVYLTLIPVARHNRLAMLDGTVTFLFCLLILLFLKLYNQLALTRKKYQQISLFGIGLIIGFLCLAKGFAIALLISLITLWFIIIENQSLATFFSGKALLILGLGVSPAIIWYSLQYIHYGQEFINYNLGTQTFNRVINTVENNSQPVWYYCLELIKYTLPWLVFLPGGIKLAIKQWDKTWAKLTLIWLGGYGVIISLMTTKLPWYIIPIYPAFALLVGANLERIVELQKRKKITQNTYQICFFLLSIIFWLATIYYAFLNNPRDVSLLLIAITLSVTFTLSTILISQQSPYFLLSLAVGLYVALLTLFSSPHSIWELAEAYPVKPVAKLIRETTPPTTTIYTSYPYYRPSLNFYSDRLIVPVSEAKLAKMLSEPKKIYLLLSKDTPLINKNRVIGATEQWRIVTSSSS